MTNTHFIKKAAAPVAGLAVLAAGIVSAAATDPIPNPLPNAVAGNIIQASDINDLVASITILDERTMQSLNTNTTDLVTKGYVDGEIAGNPDDSLSVPVYNDHADLTTGGGHGGITASASAVDGSTIFFQGKEYGVVASPATGELWLDRNLGASQACTHATDTQCFGDLYQWGRDNDGHEYYIVSNDETGQSDTITPNHNKFLKGSSDWTTADADGSARTAFLNTTDGSGACPAGFRVPTEAELTAEQGGITSGTGHFLNVPLTGYRNYATAAVSTQARHGYLWSSTADADEARSLIVNASGSAWYTYHRGFGFSLRCLKD